MELIILKMLEAVIIALNWTDWVETDPDLYHFIGDSAQDAVYKLEYRIANSTDPRVRM